MTNAVILNAGGGAWAFEEVAQHLAQQTRLPVGSAPARRNYVLGWDRVEPPRGECFVPYPAIRLAADKRSLAEVFARNQVPTPRTVLLPTPEDVRQWVQTQTRCRWVLKWPIGCGASGHQLLDTETPIPTEWPRPYVVQEFVRMDTPEVYRLYCVAGTIFGWNVRRFPSGAKSSPFVAHARGARYEEAGAVPPEAERIATDALLATGLLSSFGCVDLLRDSRGRWVALEVNTDGIDSHVDRDISIEIIQWEMEERLASAVREFAAA